MLNKKVKLKRTLYQIFSFLLPLIIILPVFGLLGLTPFGSNNLMVSDLGTQYTPFFSELNELLAGNSSWFYSFSSGMGDSFLPLAAYYLMSPFNLLFLLVSEGHITTMVTIVIILKICCLSGSLHFYLQRTFKEINLGTLIFPLAYAFCGFVGIYLYNVMWLDALILLPLLAYGIQLLVERGSYYFYCLVLFATIFTNYYLGYMTCIFAVLYFLYWSLKSCEYLTIKTYFKNTIKIWRQFIFSSVIAAGLSSIILVPAISGMLETGKTNVDYQIFLPKPRFFLEGLVQLGLENTDYASRLSHLPSIFVGSLVVILAIVYFFLGSISKKDKRLAFGLMGLLFLSFFIQTFTTTWHMMQVTAGFPYRNSYILSFFLIVLAYQSWLRLSEITLRLVLKIVSSLVFLLTLGYVVVFYLAPKLSIGVLEYRDMTISWSVWRLSVIFYLLSGCLLGLSVKYKKVAFVLLIVLSVELGFNFKQMLEATPIGDNQAFLQNFSQNVQLVEKLKQKDSDIYRIDTKLKGLDNGYNSSYLYHYFGIPSYSSTLKEPLRQSLVDLGMYSKNERRISDVGINPFLSYLFNVRYRLELKESSEKKPIIETETAQASSLFPADQTSLGYLMPDSVEKMELTKSEAFDNQNKLAQLVLGSKDTELFVPVFSKKIDDSSEYELTAKAEGKMYAYLVSEKVDALRLSINDQEVLTKLPVTNQALLSLGYFKKGQKVKLSFLDNSPVELKAGDIRTLDSLVLKEVTAKLSQNHFHVTRWQPAAILGDVTVAESEQLLFLSIPYDRDWQIEVDGQPAAGKRVIGNFLGVSLSKGQHSVALKYVPKAFEIGKMLSFFAFLLLLSAILVNKRPWRWINSPKR